MLTNNVIAGNYIGTDPAGTVALGNNSVVSSSDLLVLRRVAIPFQATLISGNGHFGILLRDGSVTGNSVVGNHIGVNANGNTLPNGRSESGDDGLAGTDCASRCLHRRAGQCDRWDSPGCGEHHRFQ